MDQVNFFGADTTKKWWRFSNFAELPIWVDGKLYKTSEHYFQSMKFIKLDPDYAEMVRLADTPKKSKTLGKSREHPINPNWDGDDETEYGHKHRVMRTALASKAFQHSDFVNDLLDTKDLYIAEASPWDGYWGTGRNKKGKNMLGVMLMELRKVYKANHKTAYGYKPR